MTQNTSPQSMRYSIDEVLSAMLSLITQDRFTDDTQRTGEVFKFLSQAHPLFAQFAAGSGEEDFSAILWDALQKLVDKGLLHHEPGHYFLSSESRVKCTNIRRLAFKASDIEQLKAAAHDFDTQMSL